MVEFGCKRHKARQFVRRLCHAYQVDFVMYEGGLALALTLTLTLTSKPNPDHNPNPNPYLDPNL